MRRRRGDRRARRGDSLGARPRCFDRAIHRRGPPDAAGCHEEAPGCSRGGDTHAAHGVRRRDRRSDGGAMRVHPGGRLGGVVRTTGHVRDGPRRAAVPRRARTERDRRRRRRRRHEARPNGPAQGMEAHRFIVHDAGDVTSTREETDGARHRRRARRRRTRTAVRPVRSVRGGVARGGRREAPRPGSRVRRRGTFFSRSRRRYVWAKRRRVRFSRRDEGTCAGPEAPVPAEHSGTAVHAPGPRLGAGTTRGFTARAVV